jgi:hypothetical protein
MKQTVSPTVIIAIVVLAVVVVAGIGFYVWRAPSVTAAPGVKTDAQGITIQSPRAGGAPDAEALRKRDEYYRQHPEQAGK